MRALPFDLRFAVGETLVHLVHGSPRKVNEYLFAAAAVAREVAAAGLPSEFADKLVLAA